MSKLVKLVRAVQNNQNLTSNLLSYAAHSLWYLDVSIITVPTLLHTPTQVGNCYTLHFGDTKQMMKQTKTYLSGVTEKFVGRVVFNVLM